MPSVEELLQSSRRHFTNSPSKSKSKISDSVLSKDEPKEKTKKKVAAPLGSQSSQIAYLEERNRQLIGFLNELADNDSELWKRVRREPVSVSALIQNEVKKALRG